MTQTKFETNIEILSNKPLKLLLKYNNLKNVYILNKNVQIQ